MTTYAITGATGHLGRLVVESLIAQGVPAASITATGRQLDKIKDLTDRGVRTVPVDYADEQSLRTAFAGADKLLFVSGSEVGGRIPQHTAIVDAARAANVGLVAYTSAPHADTTDMLLAAEHKATEALLHESGLPVVALRNNWYFENYTAQIPTFRQLGAVHGAAGEGRVSGASRADYAAAAAAVLLSAEDQAGKVYELAGDTSFSLPELAAEVSRATGREIAYVDHPGTELEQILLGAGLPAPFASVLADVDRVIAAGGLQDDSRTLSGLTGQPTATLAEAVAAAV